MKKSFKEFINGLKRVNGIQLPKSNVLVADANKFINSHYKTTLHYMQKGNKRIANLYLDRLKEYSEELNKLGLS